MRRGLNRIVPLVCTAIGALVLVSGCASTAGMDSPAASVAVPDSRESSNLFSDTFAEDTRSSYGISTSTDYPPDEYGAIRENDAAEVFHMPANGSFYVETKDNDSVTISRDIRPVTSGTVILEFVPRVIYAANGRISITLHGDDGKSSHSFDLAGGYYQVGVTKSAGARVLSDLRPGPYFTRMHKLGDYDGEMEILWHVLNPQNHRAVLQFSPAGTVGSMDGEIVSQVSDPAMTPVTVNRISIRIFQLECELNSLSAYGTTANR